MIRSILAGGLACFTAACIFAAAGCIPIAVLSAIVWVLFGPTAAQWVASVIIGLGITLSMVYGVAVSVAFHEYE